MKITVTEAMRLKNEVSQKIVALQRAVSKVQYGVLREGDNVVGEQNGVRFPDYLVVIKKAFEISEALNSQLSRFNVNSGISDMVRKKANLTCVLQYLEVAIEQSSTRKVTRYETVGQTRTPITQVFTPIVSKGDLKLQAKQVKAIIRKLQSDIDAINAELLDLPFSYEDLESLTLEVA